MDKELINILLAFLEGLAVIISPCILPILPIILSGSVSSGKRRPFGIILGFIVSFTVFSLILRQAIKILDIDPNLIYNFSLIVLGILGLTLLLDSLSNTFAKMTQSLSNLGHKLTQKQDVFAEKDGFKRGFWTGVLIAMIWTPCAGPILGAVLVQSASQPTDFMGLVTVLAFTSGVAIPMLAITLTGRTLLNNLSFLKDNFDRVRKVFGVLIILSVLYLAGIF